MQKKRSFKLAPLAGAVGLVFAGAQVSTANELDLDISLIIDAVYFNTLSTGNESPAGFSSGHHHHGHSHDHGHSHSHGCDEGFNMGPS